MRYYVQYNLQTANEHRKYNNTKSYVVTWKVNYTFIPSCQIVGKMRKYYFCHKMGHFLIRLGYFEIIRKFLCFTNISEHVFNNHLISTMLKKVITELISSPFSVSLFQSKQLNVSLFQLIRDIKDIRHSFSLFQLFAQICKTSKL